MSRNVSAVLLCGTIAGVLAWAGHTLLFHCFMLYDDEGYVLVSLKNFSLHGSLYDQVYSQYGPAFFLIYDALHRLLGFAWTNTAGRWITLVNWMGTVVFCGLLVRRARGSWPLVACVLVGTFSFLQDMKREPMHPGSTITLIVAVTAWLGWETLRAGRIDAFAAVTGVMGALLALMKINVGVFLILAAVFWLVLALPSKRRFRRDEALVMVGCLLPLALMRTRIHEDWTQIFATVAALSVTSAVLAAAPTVPLLPTTVRAWRWFAGTGLAVAGLTACAMLPRGTNLPALWQGVVVGPLKHPGAYAFGPPWLPGTVGLAAATLGLLLFARSRPMDGRLPLIIAWLKIAAAAAYVYCLVRYMDTRQGIQGLSYGVPLAGLFAWPLAPDDPARRPADQARAWLALLLVFQCLHAYPVAGSQLSWGTFLWVPLMALGFEDALHSVSKTLAPNIAGAMRAVSLAVLSLLPAHEILNLSVTSLALLTHDGFEPVAEPGAERISMPASYSSAMRILAENARVHGDVLFSLPGMYSFNLWTDVPTPTLANATHWFSLLDDAQQQAIIQRLEAASHPAVIVQHTVLEDVVRSGVQPRGPLIDYLFASFHRAFAIDSYSFWVRNGRSIAPLSTGTIQAAPGADAARLQLELTIAPRAAPIDRVHLYSIAAERSLALRLDASQTDVSLRPVHLDGTAAGAPHAASWPWSIDERSLVTLSFTTPEPLPPADTLEVILLDAGGASLGSARIITASGMALTAEGLRTP